LCLIDEHHGNTIANREGESIEGTDERRRIPPHKELSLTEGTHQNIKELRIHPGS
jgi:hypothetical protein